MFVAPGAVTRQIDILEHHYGAPLIERTPRGIKLTREGEFLAQAVDATLRELDAVKERISSTQSVVSGTVRICSAESLIAAFIARLSAPSANVILRFRLTLILAVRRMSPNN